MPNLKMIATKINLWYIIFKQTHTYTHQIIVKIKYKESGEL